MQLMMGTDAVSPAAEAGETDADLGHIPDLLCISYPFEVPAKMQSYAAR